MVSCSWPGAATQRPPISTTASATCRSRPRWPSSAEHYWPWERFAGAAADRVTSGGGHGPPLFFGSSPNSGESGPDLEEEVGVVAEAVSHPLDDLDLIIREPRSRREWRHWPRCRDDSRRRRASLARPR